MSDYKYRVGGSLSHQDASYVKRKADIQLERAIKQGEFCYVFNSRQMGKSSLLVKTKHQLEQEEFCCIAIDLTGIGSENTTVEQWYKGFIYQLYLGIKLAKINLKNWWKEQQEQDISLVQRLNNFIFDIILPQLSNHNLVIFIDEIDSIFKLSFSTDDFFAFLRFCYNQRAINAKYNRLTFVLFGVATPSQLIDDHKITPFNIGQSIKLTGFDLKQVEVLAKGLPYSPRINELILERILFWTSGQPFLTQKICRLIVHNGCEIKPDTINISIDKLVQKHIIHNWEQQDDPEHLRTISNRILAKETISLSILGLYQEMLWKYEICKSNSIEQRELFLSGLVTEFEGKLQVKNLVYQKIFNLQWVEKHLAQFRPYASQLNKWLASNKEDKSQLLQNASIEYSLDWAKDKRLANLDYQFLSASQEAVKKQIEYDLNREKIAKQKVEIALEAAKEAHSVLARLKVSAIKKYRSFRLNKIWLIAIISGLSIFIIFLRVTGNLQSLELAAFDYLMKINTSSTIVNPITIISITELDIQNIKQYPISDSILAQAINNLKKENPLAIGLDIYRDIPVEPGNKKLNEIFSNTPNLIGIEKKIGSKINPPLILSSLEQVGFNDVVLDIDAKVRRALLSYKPKSENLHFSFALKLALIYLKEKNITPKYFTKNNSKIRLGKTVFTPLRQNSGSYINAKTGGYQILLKYYSDRNNFAIFSFSDLLNNKVPVEAINNKIVLIGATAESLNDFFLTPYHNQKLIPGVYIQANTINQIINAALSGRGLIKVWTEYLEWLWIAFWTATGAIIIWLSKAEYQKYILITVTIFSLIFAVYIAWLFEWWIPFIPPLIGLILATIVTHMITKQKREKIQLQHTVKLLQSISKEKPAASRIAIEYLKIGESAKNARTIAKLLKKKID